jgi:hypothetical protein
MFAHVNVAVLREMLAVAFFVTLIPKVTVFANAGTALTRTIAAAAAMNRTPFVYFMSTRSFELVN